MLQPDEFLSLDEDLDTAELLRALPEIRHNLELAPKEEQLGLRSLLDWPEPGGPHWAHHAA